MSNTPIQPTDGVSRSNQIGESDLSRNSELLPLSRAVLGESKRSRRNLFTKFVSILGASFFIKKSALSAEQIVRAWEDPEFRKSLSAKQWESLPENPAGKIENAEFSGNLVASGNSCSGNSCSGNSCSGNSCSGNSCSGNSCSGNSCSGNSCSGNSCSGNSCSGNSCSGNNCSGNNCSGNNCSGNNCSGNNCSGNNCSGNSCSGNNCSGNNCSGNNCSNNCTVFPNCDDDATPWG
jgi:mersacidin/lichenicidin family type 2 lantibiotic